MKVTQLDHIQLTDEASFSQVKIEACGVYVTLFDRGHRLDIRVDPINREWITRLNVLGISAHDTQIAVEVAGTRQRVEDPA